MLPQSIASVVQAAINTDRGVELDIYIVSTILEQRRPDRGGRAARPATPPRRFAINLTPLSLLDPAVRGDRARRHRSARPASIRTSITIECTEQQSVPDIGQLQRQVKALRKLGFGFAVDDAGAGYASFALIAALRPSVIKIDREIVHGIGHDDAKQALVEAFVSFGRRIGAHLLAEGIERRADLAALTDARRRARPGLPARAARRRSRPPPRRSPSSRPSPGAALAYHRGHEPSRSPTTSGPSSTDERYATIATIDPDGAPRQAVVWYTVDGDEIVINSAVGRRWPANLLRDPRISLAVIDAADGYRWVGLIGTVRAVTDQATAQADIAAMARRYRRGARRGRADSSATGSSARSGSRFRIQPDRRPRPPRLNDALRAPALVAADRLAGLPRCGPRRRRRPAGIRSGRGIT